MGGGGVWTGVSPLPQSLAKLHSSGKSRKKSGKMTERFTRAQYVFVNYIVDDVKESLKHIMMLLTLYFRTGSYCLLLTSAYYFVSVAKNSWDS